MKTLNRFCVTLVVLLLFYPGIPAARGIDISQTVWLDRYTVLDNGSLQHETGHLLKKGQFQVITTEVVDPFWVDINGIDTFIPISGKPIMDATLFDSYKAAGYIPWIRSQNVFQIGYEYFVIVMPKAFKPVTIKTPLGLRPVKAGKSAKLRVAVQGTKPFTYQWYFNSIPYDPASDFSTWYQNFAPIYQATNKLYAISNAQTESAGMYFVIVGNGMSSATSGLLGLYVQP